MGATSSTFMSPDGSTKESIENLGTLIADIVVDYQRLGEEYVHLEHTTSAALSKKSHLQCLLLEFDHGLVAVSSCVGVDYFVIGIAAPNAPLGMIKARLQAITEHVQEALASVSDAFYR